jgi:hypothetical protein
MSDTLYKLWVRNPDDSAWINALRETNIYIEDPDGRIGADRLDEALYEILDLIAQIGGGGPGYLGTRIEIYADDTDSTSSSDNAASFSTIGGASIAKSLNVGLDITTDSDLNAVNVVATTDISSSTITGLGTGDITGYVNITASEILSADTLALVTGVSSDLNPDTDLAYTLGTGSLRWSEIHGGTISAVSGFTGDITGNVTGNVTGDLDGNLLAATTIANTISAVSVVTSGVGSFAILTATDVQGSLTSSTGGNLGAVGSEWSNLYATNVEATVATVSTLNATVINSANFTGTFTGNLTGNVVGDLTGNVQGDLNGNLTNDFTEVTSGWDLLNGDPADAFRVYGGAKIDKNLTVGGNQFINGNLTVTGNITGGDTGAVDWANIPESMIPDTNASWDIGTPTRTWAQVYATGFTGAFTGDLTGNLIGDLTSPTTTKVTAVTGSTSPSTGALTVDGGVGIQENLYVGQDLVVGGSIGWSGSFNPSSISTDQIWVNGLVPSTDKDTGALVVGQGGVGVEGDINLGGAVYADTVSSYTDNTNLVLVAKGTGQVETTSELLVSANGTFQSNLVVEAGFTNTVDIDVDTDIFGILNVSNTTGSPDTTVGALVVAGGVGIAENLNVGGITTVTGDILPFDGTQSLGAWDKRFEAFYGNGVILEDTATSQGITLYNNEAGDPSIVMYTENTGYMQLQPKHANIAYWFRSDTIHTTGSILDIDNGDGADLFNVRGIDVQSHVPLHVTNVTASSDKDTGALVVEGGVGIEENLNVGGQIAAVGGFFGDLTGDINADVISATSITADTITSTLGFHGDLTKITQVQVTNPETANAMGEGAFYVAGGVVGPAGAGMSVNGNTYVGGNLVMPTAGTDITLPSGRTVEQELDARPVENGFVNSNESIMTFDDITRQLTIEPNTGDGFTEFTYYAGGVKHVVTGPVVSSPG